MFVSHTGQDPMARNFAANLSARLDDKGIPYFYDVDSLRPGVEWQQGIHENVKGCGVFLAVLSPTYCCRYWTMTELAIAVTHRRTNISGWTQ